MILTARARRIRLAVVWLWVATIGVCLGAVVVAWLAGWRLQSVDSASMSPAVRRGSLAIVVPTAGDRIEEGDVIAFRDPTEPDRRILHRVISVAVAEDGTRFYQTRGDANRTPDPMLVPATAVAGRLQGQVPFVGRIAWVIRPPVGLLVLVGVPLLPLTLAEVAGRRRRSPVPDAVITNTEPSGALRDLEPPVGHRGDGHVDVRNVAADVVRPTCPRLASHRR